MYGVLQDFVGDETGTTAIDYGLMTAIVVAAAFSAFASLGNDFLGFLSHVGCMISDQAACALSNH